LNLFEVAFESFLACFLALSNLAFSLFLPAFEFLLGYHSVSSWLPSNFFLAAF
jgi:hypothetical protein